MAAKLNTRQRVPLPQRPPRNSSSSTAGKMATEKCVALPAANLLRVPLTHTDSGIDTNTLGVALQLANTFLLCGLSLLPPSRRSPTNHQQPRQNRQPLPVPRESSGRCWGAGRQAPLFSLLRGKRPPPTNPNDGHSRPPRHPPQNAVSQPPQKHLYCRGQGVQASQRRSGGTTPERAAKGDEEERDARLLFHHDDSAHTPGWCPLATRACTASAPGGGALPRRLVAPTGA